jgi:nitrate reductase NapAB chaperone NapD
MDSAPGNTPAAGIRVLYTTQRIRPMPVCSYLVFPDRNNALQVAERLAAIPGCEVTPAENRDLLLLVTETEDPEEERALRVRVHGVEGVLAMMLTFGELDGDRRSEATADEQGAQ